MTIEQQLRKLAEEGELNYFSVAFIGRSYHAAVMPCTPYNSKSFRGVHADPVKALEEALSQCNARFKGKKPR